MFEPNLLAYSIISFSLDSNGASFSKDILYKIFLDSTLRTDQDSAESISLPWTALSRVAVAVSVHCTVYVGSV